MEVKNPGWRPTSTKDRLRISLQRAWLERQRRHGACTGVVTSPEDAMVVLASVDKSIDEGSEIGYHYDAIH